jgi:hypothetical protein
MSRPSSVPGMIPDTHSTVIPLVFLFAVIGLLLPAAGAGVARAEGCLDYSEYLHWAGCLQSPGWADEIALQGALGYLANGSDDGDDGSISVLDLTDPRSPHIMSTLATPGFAVDIAAVDGLVCVADGLDGLTIVDASDPGQPLIVARVENLGFVGCVALSGRIALAGADNVLYAIDLTTPTSPVVLDQIAADRCTDIAVEGTYAYVACNYTGLRIYNIDQPAALSMVSWLNSGGHEIGLAVSLPYAYLAGEEYGLGVVDVSDPAAPRVVGRLDTQGIAAAVAVRGGRAFVVNSGGLAVVDVGDPTRPVLQGAVELRENPNALALIGDFALVACGFAGVQVVDVAHSTTAEPVGGTGPLSMCQDIAVSGGLAYLADGPGGLAVVDFADPANPQVIGRCQLPESGRASAVAVQGRMACVIDERRFLHTLDITNPHGPVITGSVALPDYPRGLAMSGGRALVACNAAGLVMVEVGEPTRMRVGWTYDTPGWAYAVEWRNDLVYLGDAYDGLLILSVADPNAPVLVSRLGEAGSVRDVSVDGRYACLALDASTGGLRLVDISDPAHPALVGTPVGTGYPYCVLLSWPMVYESNDEGRLVIHDTSDPSGMTFVGSYCTSRQPIGLARSGDLLFLALYNEGLQICRPQCGDAADVPGPATAPGGSIALNVPNPLLPPATLRLDLQRTAAVTLSVYDVAGRRVRELYSGRLHDGSHSLIWDGTTDQGGRASAGVYFIRCQSEAVTVRRSVSVLR